MEVDYWILVRIHWGFLQEQTRMAQPLMVGERHNLKEMLVGFVKIERQLHLGI